MTMYGRVCGAANCVPAGAGGLRLRALPPPARYLPARRPAVSAAAAAAPAAQAVYEATGVPLVDALMQLPTVQAAGQQAIQLVAVAAAGVVVASLVLAAVERAAGSGLSGDGQHLNLPAAALAAVLHPLQALLPFYGLAYSATVASSLAQVAATKMASEFSALCFGRGKEVLAVIKAVTQAVQDTSELVVIIGAAWAAIRFKDSLLAWATTLLTKRSGSSGGGLAVALLRPLSTVASALIFFAAGATALAAYGVNVGPLLASVGGLSLAVGLATQSVAANAVAAMSLYSGGLFAVGDRVQLLAGGAPVVEGTVEALEPLVTTIRDAEGTPIYMSNAEVAACSVRNLSRKRA